MTRYRSVLVIKLAVAILLLMPVSIVQAGGLLQTPATASANYAVRVRSGPGTAYGQVGLLAAGTQVSVQGRNAATTWLNVEYAPGSMGWVAAWLMDIHGDATSLPVVSGGSPAPPGATATPPIQSGYSVTVSGIGPHTREIFEQGRTLGNYPNRFTKVGDSEMALPQTFTGFDSGSYLLGTWDFLESAIRYFRGSFAHQSEAALAGLTPNVLFDPFWADPDRCQAGENLLECEYRRYRPSVAFILVRIHGSDDWEARYEQYVEEVIDTSLGYGVIPVLTLQFRFNDVPAAADEMNYILRRLGAQHDVPVWDLYTSTAGLPDYGVDPTNHLTTSPDNNFDFDNPDNLQYGKVVHNLEALQILHMILNQIIRAP